MQPSSCRLEELLPHRPPMVLIDEIVGYDLAARQLTAAVTVRDEWRENWVAVEFMAQTAAALAGLFDRESGARGAARPGFLLGTRKLTLPPEDFTVGRRYLVTAENVFHDDESASFACTVRDGEEVVASAVLNAYRPDDLDAFLRQQRGDMV